MFKNIVDLQVTVLALTFVLFLQSLISFKRFFVADY